MQSLHSISQQILNITQLQPNAPALLSPGQNPTSYQQLTDLLQAVTRRLAAWGFSRADRIAVVLPNGPDAAAAFLAISTVCACAPLNPAYTREEFTFSLQDLGIKALVTSFPTEHPCRQAANAAGITVISLVSNPSYAGLFTLEGDLPVSSASVSYVEPDDVALLLHTSGTTSRPKIVPLTHRNLLASARNIISTYALTPQDRCLNMMPLFHIHGLVGAVASTLCSGGSVICAPGFNPEQVMSWLADQKPTWYTAVPSMHHAVLEAAAREPEKRKDLSLRFIRSCSSSLPPTLAQKLEEEFSVPVLEAYGMTEAAHQMASNPLPPGKNKHGSVGSATGTTSIAILDAQGTPLPAGQTGEICIRGENVIHAYEGNPAANQSSFVDGWLRTGDLGTLDGDGYLFIQGRVKELINRGGEKISPREIDDVLMQHQAVSEAVSFGVPHPTLGEDVAAAVVLRSNQTLSMLELRQFASTKLADHKIPRQIVFLAEIPKGPTGKFQRVLLAEKLKDELAKIRASTPITANTPLTPTEAALLPLWQDVLEQRTITIQDDFLALGGDSIMAGRLLLQVEHQFGVMLTLKDIFATPTIASMATLIDELQAS